MLRVVDVEADATYDLRRRVLRAHIPGAPVAYEDDRDQGTVHLAVVDGEGSVVASATLLVEGTAHRPGKRALRLRGMAVDPAHQSEGVGSLLLAALVDRARTDGYQVLWANGRDSALGFYRLHGWEVVGEGFTAVGLPHHVVLLDL